MIKLYGVTKSRARRCLWALEELNLKYQQIPIEISDAHKPENLKVNPNGHIPTLDDNGTIIWESMAINLYLADKYGKDPFWPQSPEMRGRAYQWSFWGVTELESHLLTLLYQSRLAPPEKRDEAAAQQAEERLKKSLKVLDDHLKQRDYLLDKHFSIADLNVASILAIGTYINLDLSTTPAVQKWLEKCLSREPIQRILNRDLVASNH